MIKSVQNAFIQANKNIMKKEIIVDQDIQEDINPQTDEDSDKNDFNNRNNGKDKEYTSIKERKRFLQNKEIERMIKRSQMEIKQQNLQSMQQIALLNYIQQSQKEINSKIEKEVARNQQRKVNSVTTKFKRAINKRANLSDIFPQPQAQEPCMTPISTENAINSQNQFRVIKKCNAIDFASEYFDKSNRAFQNTNSNLTKQIIKSSRNVSEHYQSCYSCKNKIVDFSSSISDCTIHHLCEFCNNIFSFDNISNCKICKLQQFYGKKNMDSRVITGIKPEEIQILYESTLKQMELDKNYKPDHDFLFNGKNDKEILCTDIQLVSPLYYEPGNGQLLDIQTKKYSRINSNPSTPKALKSKPDHDQKESSSIIKSCEPKNSQSSSNSSGKKKKNKKNKKEKSSSNKNMQIENSETAAQNQPQLDIFKQIRKRLNDHIQISCWNSGGYNQSLIANKHATKFQSVYESLKLMNQRNFLHYNQYFGLSYLPPPDFDQDQFAQKLKSNKIITWRPAIYKSQQRIAYQKCQIVQPINACQYWMVAKKILTLLRQRRKFMVDFKTPLNQYVSSMLCDSQREKYPKMILKNKANFVSNQLLGKISKYAVVQDSNYSVQKVRDEKLLSYLDKMASYRSDKQATTHFRCSYCQNFDNRSRNKESHNNIQVKQSDILHMNSELVEGIVLYKMKQQNISCFYCLRCAMKKRKEFPNAQLQLIKDRKFLFCVLSCCPKLMGEYEIFIQDAISNSLSDFKRKCQQKCRNILKSVNEFNNEKNKLIEIQQKRTQLSRELTEIIKRQSIQRKKNKIWLQNFEQSGFKRTNGQKNRKFDSIRYVRKSDGRIDLIDSDNDQAPTTQPKSSKIVQKSDDSLKVVIPIDNQFYRADSDDMIDQDVSAMAKYSLKMNHGKETSDSHIYNRVAQSCIHNNSVDEVDENSSSIGQNTIYSRILQYANEKKSMMQKRFSDNGKFKSIKKI